MTNQILNKNLKNTLVYYKLNSDDPLKKRMIEDLENSDNYFNTDKDLLIGKVIKRPKFDKNHRIIPHTVVGPLSLFDVNPGMVKNLSKAGSKLYNYLLVKTNKEEKPKQTVQMVNNVEINRIYDIVDSRIKKTNVIFVLNRLMIS